MHDPLSELVKLLRPNTAHTNIITGKGSWAVRYSEYGLPSFCIVLEGSCLLEVKGLDVITIRAGDFILLPMTPAFTLSSFAPAPSVSLDPHEIANRRTELRYGETEGVPDIRILGGSFVFDCYDPGLLISLLPKIVHIHGARRLTQLVQMVNEEHSEQKPGGEFMLSRLIEMLLVEAMRSTTGASAPPGLLRGLGDERLGRALKQLHSCIGHPWTVNQLAKIATLSRSAFFMRFTRLVGVPPMEYLLSWRMAIARELLRENKLTISEIAEHVGYGSTSAFSVAFRRQAGLSPGQFSRTQQ